MSQSVDSIRRSCQGQHPQYVFRSSLPLMWFGLAVIAANFIICIGLPEGSPRSVCLRNCHLCEQMYQEHFEGHLCAQSCVKQRGSVIPDCTNLESISQFMKPNTSNNEV